MVVQNQTWAGAQSVHACRAQTMSTSYTIFQLRVKERAKHFFFFFPQLKTCYWALLKVFSFWSIW